MRILVIGAGAIGRGFVAPLLARVGIEIDFADTDNAVLEAYSGRTHYLTAVADSKGYEISRVKFEKAMAPEQIGNINVYDAVFISVGPNNYLSYGTQLRHAKAVFVLENVRDSDKRLREASGNKRIWFGIPDVIVSNTAPSDLLQRDPLCVVAEKGDLVLHKGINRPEFGDAVILVDAPDLEKHWICKFFIHNASHAIVAFLGALGEYKFVHEAMADDRIRPIVERSIQVICEAISVQGWVTEELVTAYMARELKRFKNPLLFDPISRVARDPLRKLAGGDRLMRALDLVVASGLDGYPIMLGVDAALNYCGKTEDDIRFDTYRHLHSKEEILRKVCGLQDEQTICQLINTSARKYLACPS